MTQEFYSNGKLLLSGEYAILDGAAGWAIPTKFGQYLTITTTTTARLNWTSLDADGSVWFNASYAVADFKEISSSDKEISKNLVKILHEIRSLNPSFLTESQGCDVQTKLTFPRNWGLGTSSTLIANLSSWATVNPYTLLAKTFGGSAYDIACAQHNTPIVYQLKDGVPEITKMNSTPPFMGSLFFVYLNQKKNSREAITAYRSLDKGKEQLTQELSAITQKMIASQELSVFEDLMTTHEEKLSQVLQIAPIKEILFPDYLGSIKSLGAWGGDFVMATGNTETPAYFKSKGYTVVFPYVDMIL